VPQWLKREASVSEGSMAETGKRSVPPKFIWLAAILIVAVAAFSAGGYIQRNRLLASAQGNLKELKAKDQIIQSSETQIQNLQTQLAQARQELTESSTQLTGLKTKLEQSQKDLSVAQQRLGVATHEVERLNASRAQPPTRVASRAPDPVPPPARSTPRTPDPLPPPPQSRQASTGDTGVFETTRPTKVFQDPSSSAHPISEIPQGTRINVVSNSGGWLEVHSRRGNPPGYVRADDARYVGRSN
jgi:Skp family chaperone for outer membrane proteins